MGAGGESEQPHSSVSARVWQLHYGLSAGVSLCTVKMHRLTSWRCITVPPQMLLVPDGQVLVTARPAARGLDSADGLPGQSAAHNFAINCLHVVVAGIVRSATADLYRTLVSRTAFTLGTARLAAI
jgi:hypothetical protein